MYTFTASTAREYVKAAHAIDGAYLRDETDKIMKEIANIALTGQSEYNMYSFVDPIICKRLRELGFVVSVVHCQRDGDTTTVSWAE